MTPAIHDDTIHPFDWALLFEPWINGAFLGGVRNSDGHLYTTHILKKLIIHTIIIPSYIMGIQIYIFMCVLNI